MRKTLGVALSLILVLGTSAITAAQQGQADVDELKKSAVKVFLDCDSCDVEYVKTEITFVNYVRDRLEAQVHILITTQSTGGGGREYTLNFMGQNDLKGTNDIQKYFSSTTDTSDDVRRGLVKALKMGLMSYVAKTSIARRITVDYLPPDKAGPGRDRWNFWVFSLTGSGRFSGEESYKDRNADFSFSANRVTTKSKVRLGLSLDTSKTKYDIEDEIITGTKSSWDGSGLFVKSLGEHWSAGFFLEAESSLYSNIDLGLTAAPALEYNAFPYSQSTRRQLRFLYKLAVNPVKYREETIYGKTRETLFQESLSATLDLREKWGTVSVSATGSHYFHDFGKNQLDLFGIVSLNLYKGLSVFGLVGYSWIHDQLSLLGREPTFEEQLLRLRELPRTSDYFVSIGFQFTFGSIFTNVINPRFGSSGGGGMSIRIN
ncbi:MAG: hypothetical protein A2W03_16810 [Candidatus Aminicenantes bacterium RBG_16_63_16]|jgi:hypothetical protein|nr:MAG: hypothetical protein A2W03_16810 [Candidatus Aminicenantes bacterium RBG_16_63_16]